MGGHRELLWVRAASLTVVSHFVLFGRVGSRSGLSVAPFSLALCRSSSPARSGRFARPSALVSTRRCSGWPACWVASGPGGRRAGAWPGRMMRRARRRGLRDHLRLGPGEAGRLAHALGRELPVTAAALAHGRPNREDAHTVAGAVRVLPAETPAQTPVLAEQALAEHAATADPDAARMPGRHVLDIVDPDHAEELLHRQAEHQAAQAHTRRDPRITPARPRPSRATGSSTPKHRHPTRHPRPTRRTTPADPENDTRDDRTHSQRTADTPVKLTDPSLRTGDLPDNSAERPPSSPQLPHDKLGTGTETLDSGDILPASQARRIACPTRTSPPPSWAAKACPWTPAAAPDTTSTPPAAPSSSATTDAPPPAPTVPTNSATPTTTPTEPTTAEPTRTTTRCRVHLTTTPSTTTAET